MEAGEITGLQGHSQSQGHSHCTAFRNDNIGHKIIVVVLSCLNYVQ